MATKEDPTLMAIDALRKRIVDFIAEHEVLLARYEILNSSYQSLHRRHEDLEKDFEKMYNNAMAWKEKALGKVPDSSQG